MDAQQEVQAKHFEMPEIEAGLAALGPSPKNQGTVEMIVCRPEREQRQVLTQAELDLVEGMVGDNWKVRGSKSTEDGSADPEAQITLMNSRVIEALTQDRERWALAGDQLFVDFDLSDENLPVGQRIAIGTAILEVSATPHTGCAKFTERFGSNAIRFVNSSEGRANRRRGVNMRIVQAGVIAAGDVITKVE